MSLAKVHSAAVLGIAAFPVEVVLDIRGAGMAAFQMAGLLDMRMPAPKPH